MKVYQILYLGCFLLVANMSIAQNKTEKDIELQEAKVDTVYTVEERANIQRWFYERVNDMQLKPDVRDDYDRIINKYVFDMSRLNDADKNYTREEIHDKFDEMVDKMNTELKSILTTDQYVNHLENFGEIQRSVYRRWNFKN
ncbi:hypothetical protein SAMN04487989_10264 [Bizionia echini]|uniref:Uncharacterized protein n=1 Tax=Bizionia echini TaxID=649333 RepID=A0A1I5AIF8_9FLAO|nr:hypothetical protein [Bizionia echini]SFN62009.1 hypothetical protein SAMN04487989_10264 [Bizionia echini]